MVTIGKSQTQLTHSRVKTHKNLAQLKGNLVTKPADRYATCFMTHTAINNKVVALSNDNGTDEDTSFTFDATPTEFGTDNCATNHVCSDRKLFSSLQLPKTSIGVRGVSGSSEASGVGTVKFKLSDDNGTPHDITLNNVIFLPGAAKNLISVTQWSSDNHDDCNVTSHGTHSIFKWDHDKYSKTIHHPPECPIPLMPVNEHNNAFTLFTEKHAQSFIDRTHESSETNGAILEMALFSNKQFDEDSHFGIASSQQPQKGDTVKTILNGKPTICTIVRRMNLSNGTARLEVRPINSSKHVIVATHHALPIEEDPSDFPTDPSQVDKEAMTHCLTEKEMQQLWNPKSDDSVPPEERITLHWHHRLRCAPLVTLKRLAKRGVLPKCILRVTHMPLCASCAFANAHRKAWGSRGSNHPHIRKQEHNKPGMATSCDHLISRQPGLVPQSSGKLTHQRYWGCVVFADHFSDYLYAHMITGTTSLQTLEAKHAYERIAKTYNVSVMSYRADNLRFNDRNFSGDCLKAGQQITFCGVGAHHQNAIAESKIKQVSQGARTILLHAKRRWPTVISTAL